MDEKVLLEGEKESYEELLNRSIRAVAVRVVEETGSDEELVRRFVMAFDSGEVRSLVSSEAAAAGLAQEVEAVGRAAGGFRELAADLELGMDLRLLEGDGARGNFAAFLREVAVGTRIFGGAPTPGGAFEDCVAVGSPWSFCCTGTLVSPDVVVTAAHCHGDGCNTRVFFGGDIRNPGSVVGFRQAIPHPQYSGSPNYRNDLALLILEQPVLHVPSRRIASTPEVDGARSCRIVGFGNTDSGGNTGYGRKREVDVPILSNGCEPQAAGLYGCHGQAELVAGAPLLGKDSCTGDSGGPLYVANGGDWRLAAATSRSVKSSQRVCGDGGIYVRLDRYLPWIRHTAQAHGAQPVP